MQPPKKITKYLDVNLDDTLPPNIPAPPPNGRGLPREIEQNPLYQHSLTPVNVLKKIHLDIVRVLGIQPMVAGKFTKLEQELIYNIEKIIRKGRCPSILTKNKELMSVLSCLQKYFDEQTVTIEMENGEGREVPTKILVFKSLFDIAVDAARCESRIRELRTLQKDLKALRARCGTPHAIEQCGILNELDTAAAQSTSIRREGPSRRRRRN